MNILNNENLAKYTTVGIGGSACQFFIPDTVDELLDLVNAFNNDELYIISGGSNLLINDEKTFEKVILLRNFNKTIQNIGNNRYYVGASVRLQKLIDYVNNEGYGGIEYLYSVPGLLGGAIAMNAGRGKKYNKSISDYVVNVHVIDLSDKTVKTIDKDKCIFKYRSSVFKNTKYVVIGATFDFDEVPAEMSSRLKQERLDLVNKLQDSGGSNFGSVFNVYNKYLIYLFKVFNVGFKNGMRFSNKTSNWMLNSGNGTYRQAVKLIKAVKMIHKIFAQTAVLEVEIWE